ncbi:hypothetical protein [Pedobacter ginsengiterrae]|uniref:hypothetical protein n=1 Tax=Pedobacter ginsengiterrae TaxID=871696 RepID=UPI0031D9AD70
MKTQEIFFIVRIEVYSTHALIDQTLQEMESTSRFLMTNTPNVKVVHAEILTTKIRNLKNNNHGA